jgi:hypothetical protein
VNVFRFPNFVKTTLAFSNGGHRPPPQFAPEVFQIQQGRQTNIQVYIPGCAEIPVVKHINNVQHQGRQRERAAIQSNGNSVVVIQGI